MISVISSFVLKYKHVVMSVVDFDSSALFVIKKAVRAFGQHHFHDYTTGYCNDDLRNTANFLFTKMPITLGQYSQYFRTTLHYSPS